MRTTPILTAIVLTLSVMVLTNVAGADAGVGACALGQGFSLTTPVVASPFVGVNVGLRNSTTGVYATQAQYEAQCCAEGNMAPDCFRPTV